MVIPGNFIGSGGGTVHLDLREQHFGKSTSDTLTHYAKSIAVFALPTGQ